MPPVAGPIRVQDRSLTVRTLKPMPVRERVNASAKKLDIATTNGSATDSANTCEHKRFYVVVYDTVRNLDNNRD